MERNPSQEALKEAGATGTGRPLLNKLLVDVAHAGNACETPQDFQTPSFEQMGFDTGALSAHPSQSALDVLSPFGNGLPDLDLLISPLLASGNAAVFGGDGTGQSGANHHTGGTAATSANTVITAGAEASQQQQQQQQQQQFEPPSGSGHGNGSGANHTGGLSTGMFGAGSLQAAAGPGNGDGDAASFRKAMGPPSTISAQMQQKLGISHAGGTNGGAGMGASGDGDKRSGRSGVLPRPPPLTIPADVPSSLITGINTGTGYSPLPSILNSPFLESLISASPNAQLAAMFAQLAQSTRGGQTPALLEALTPGTAGAWPDSTKSGGGTLRQLLDLHDPNAFGLGEGDIDEGALADALLGKGFLGVLPSARRASNAGGSSVAYAPPGVGREGSSAVAGDGDAAGANGSGAGVGELSAEQLADLGLQSPSALGVNGNGSVLYKGVHYDKEQDIWQVVVFDGSRYTVVGEYTNELEALVANELLSPAQPMPGNINTLLAGGSNNTGGQGDSDAASNGVGTAAPAESNGPGPAAGENALSQAGATPAGFGGRTPNLSDFLNRLSSNNSMLGGSMLSPNGPGLSPLFSALSPAGGGGFTALLLPTPRDPANTGAGAHLLPSPTTLGRGGSAAAGHAVAGVGAASNQIVSSSVFRGVQYQRDQRRWAAVLEDVSGEEQWLGLFDSEVEAARAYDAEALRRYGLKAELNFSVGSGSSPSPTAPPGPGASDGAAEVGFAALQQYGQLGLGFSASLGPDASYDEEEEDDDDSESGGTRPMSGTGAFGRGR
ncbi:hypothetical protein Vafri_2879, partial [Volvox africanus]